MPLCGFTRPAVPAQRSIVERRTHAARETAQVCYSIIRFGSKPLGPSLSTVCVGRSLSHFDYDNPGLLTFLYIAESLDDLGQRIASVKYAAETSL